MNTREDWRVVPEFPDYEVSSQGRVVSNRRRRPRLLTGSPGDKGYPVVDIIRADGQKKRRGIHQIVAEAFIGPRPQGQEVRHVDGDKLNPALGNLAYGTRSENIADQVRHGRHAEARKNCCVQGHPFDERNTYLTPAGKRNCRTCLRAASRAWKQRRALRAANVPGGKTIRAGRAA